MKWNLMKSGIAERAITCGLLGAATIAVASGMNRLDVFAQDPVEANKAVAPGKLVGEFELLERVADAGASGEQRLAKLVEAVEKASDADKEAKKIALKKALIEIFKTKTQAQQKRIAEMKERFQTIESQLERRMELQEQIVQRRLRELLGEKDELSWDPESAVDIGLLESGLNGKSGVATRWLLSGAGPESPVEGYLNAAMDYPKVFPAEYPVEHSFEFPLAGAAASRDRYLQRSKLGADQAERAATDAKRTAERGEQVRNAEARLRDAKMLQGALLDPTLPRGLDSLRASVSDEGRRAQMEEQLRALQEKATTLQRQMEEIARQAEEKPRKR